MQSPSDRQYPERPMVGVAALVFRGPCVLLARRGQPPAAGKWSPPGGLVEVGESLEQAVKREVLEEAGLEVEVLDLAAVLDRIIYDRENRIEYHYVLLDFLCRADGGEPTAGSDVLECRFVPLEELPRYLLTRGTEEVIRRAYDKTRGSECPVYESGR